MGRTYKIIVCGKKAVGKTAILEQLIYSNPIYSPTTTTTATTTNSQTGQRLSSSNDRYFSTIEDTYVACWEKDKGVKEKLRFYDTKGLENAKDTETLNQMKHLFSSLDGACLVFSSNDLDSIQCIEKLKCEIEKSKDRKEICHFILIDYAAPTPVNLQAAAAATSDVLSSRDMNRIDLQNKFKTNLYDLNTLDKRDLICKPFIDLASNITQIANKSSMNSLVQLKKPKVFSSNK